MRCKINLLGAIRRLARMPMTACVFAPNACRIMTAKFPVSCVAGITYCLVLAGSCSAGVRGCLSVNTAAGIFFPVIATVRLPTAQGAGVVTRIYFITFKCLRAFSAADTGHMVSCPRCTGRIGHLIPFRRHLLIIDVLCNILFAIADGTLVPMVGRIHAPGRTQVMLTHNEVSGASASTDDRTNRGSIVLVLKFFRFGIAFVARSYANIVRTIRYCFRRHADFLVTGQFARDGDIFVGRQIDIVVCTGFFVATDFHTAGNCE